MKKLTFLKPKKINLKVTFTSLIQKKKSKLEEDDMEVQLKLKKY